MSTPRNNDDLFEKGDKRSFLEKLASGADNCSEPFAFAGNRGRFLSNGVAPKMRVKYLPLDARQRARGDAQRTARAYGYDGPDLFGADGSRAAELEREVHILSHALVKEDGKTLVTTRAGEKNEPNAGRIKDLLEEEEIELLHKTWEAHQAEHSMMREGQLAEALEEARRVGKGLSPATSLLRFGTATLAFTAASLARALTPQASDDSPDTSSQNHSSLDSTDSFDGSEERTTGDDETEISSDSSDDSSPDQ